MNTLRSALPVLGFGLIVAGAAVLFVLTDYYSPVLQDGAAIMLILGILLLFTPQPKRKERNNRHIVEAIARKLTEEKDGSQKSDLTLQFKILIVLWAACGITLVVNLVHSYAWFNWLAIVFAAVAFFVNVFPPAVEVWEDIRERYLRR